MNRQALPKQHSFRALSLLFLCILLSTQFARARVLSFKKEADGVAFRLEKGLMKLKVCESDLIEVKYTTLSSLPQRNSLVVNNTFSRPAYFSVVQRSASVVITTKRLRVLVDRETDAITYTDLAGHIILAEDGAEGKTMTPATIAGIDTYNCSTRFQSPQDEALFGLGCHPVDSLSINYKGRNQDLAIRYLTGAIPVLLSTKGYGIMWDNYSASNFYGAEENNTKYRYVSESGTMVDYYFFYGPEFDHIISLYRTATGKAPMFAKWAYGLFQSQDRYKSQAEVLAVKDQYRNNKIPVDAIVQDWFYWEPAPIGSHIMQRSRYPDPAAMVNELHQANLHAMISIWPVFGKGSRNYEELVNAGGMTSITWDNVMTHTFDSYYDAHSAKARDIYWKQAKDSLIAPDGWDAWWVDQCEPDNGSLLDERRKATFALGKGIDYFNTYSLMHTTGIYDHWRKEIPDKRAFFLVRQAFAGQQRNASTLWSSDIPCTFESFKIQVPQGINACTSGYPYWTSDIGGYHYHWQAPDWSAPLNRELFTRWFQFGVFCPIFRIHGKGERALYSRNWDDKTKAILLNFDNLRYRLLPYIYSMAWEVTNDDYTIMRSLAFDFRDDPEVFNIQDQYMFGPAFMVNPVTRSHYNSPAAANAAKTREVYLPKGTEWFDFWTGKLLPGGQKLQSDAPIDILPLYVKAGSIVPMGPRLQYATEKNDDPIEVRIYPGANAKFTLYEDENDNYNYEKGQHATFTISWNDKNHAVSISPRKGTFPGMDIKKIFRIVIVGENHGVGTGISTEVDKTIIYNGVPVSVKL